MTRPARLQFVRLLFVWPLCAVLFGSAIAGDLPLTAEDALEGRALRPEEHLLIAPPLRVTALVADGTSAPAQNILGPLQHVTPGPGSYSIPPCWLYVVEPGGAPGAGLDLDYVAKAARSFEFPGLQLRMQAVDDAFVERLSGIETLEYLGLGRTRVTDAALAHAAKLPRLLALELDGLRGLSNVGLAALASHETLAALRLEGASSVTDDGVAHLATIPELVWLDLAQTGVTDKGLALLAKRGRLRVLDLRQCTGVTDKGVFALAGLKQLRGLGLASVPVTDKSLKSLAKVKSLEALDLAMTRVTAGGIAKLKSLKKLSWLSLNGLAVDDKAVTWLKSSKVIEALDLTDTQITVKGLKALAGKTTLRELKLRGPMLTDEGLKIVATCRGLRRLYLHNAGAVTNEGLAHLAALEELTTFGITAAPQLTDASLEMLATRTGLTWLNLDRCTGLTKAGVAKLRAALPSCQVMDPWRLGIR